MLVILRTLYNIELPESTSGIPKYSSSIVPISHIRSLKSIWTKTRPPSSGPIYLINRPLPYTYALEFSGATRYLIYYDTRDMKIKPRDVVEIASTLAVFNITETQRGSGVNAFSVELLGELHHRFFNGWRFHPSLPILAVHKSDGSIFLWHFHASKVAEDNESGEPSATSTIFTREDHNMTIESMSFSDCGTQLIVKWHEDPLVKVISIEKWISTTSVSPRAAASSSSSLALAMSRKSCGELGRIPLYSASLIQSGTIHLHHDDQEQPAFDILQVSNSENGSSSVSLKRSHLDKSEGIDQPILSLPDVDASRHLAVTVQPRWIKDERIRLILNKASRPWYRFSQPTDLHFPAVASKDQRALKRSDPSTESTLDKPIVLDAEEPISHDISHKKIKLGP